MSELEGPIDATSHAFRKIGAIALAHSASSTDAWSDHSLRYSSPTTATHAALKRSKNLIACSRASGFVFIVAPGLASDPSSIGLYVARASELIGLIESDRLAGEEEAAQQGVEKPSKQPDVPIDEKVFTFVNIECETPIWHICLNPTGDFLLVCTLSDLIVLSAADVASGDGRPLAILQMDQTVMDASWSEQPHALAIGVVLESGAFREYEFMPAKGMVQCTQLYDEQAVLAMCALSDEWLLALEDGTMVRLATTIEDGGIIADENGQPHIIPAHEVPEAEEGENFRIYSLNHTYADTVLVGMYVLQEEGATEKDPTRVHVAAFNVANESWVDFGDVLRDEERCTEDEEEKLYECKHRFHTPAIPQLCLSLFASNKAHEVTILGVSPESPPSPAEPVAWWMVGESELDQIIVPMDEDFRETYALGMDIDVTNRGAVKAAEAASSSSSSNAQRWPVVFMLTTDARLHVYELTTSNESHRSIIEREVMHDAERVLSVEEAMRKWQFKSKVEVEEAEAPAEGGEADEEEEEEDEEEEDEVETEEDEVTSHAEEEKPDAHVKQSPSFAAPAASTTSAFSLPSAAPAFAAPSSSSSGFSFGGAFSAASTSASSNSVAAPSFGAAQPTTTPFNFGGTPAPAFGAKTTEVKRTESAKPPSTTTNAFSFSLPNAASIPATSTTTAPTFGAGFSFTAPTQAQAQATAEKTAPSRNNNAQPQATQSKKQLDFSMPAPAKASQPQPAATVNTTGSGSMTRSILKPTQQPTPTPSPTAASVSSTSPAPPAPAKPTDPYAPSKFALDYKDAAADDGDMTVVELRSRPVKPPSVSSDELKSNLALAADTEKRFVEALLGVALTFKQMGKLTQASRQRVEEVQRRVTKGDTHGSTGFSIHAMRVLTSRTRVLASAVKKLQTENEERMSKEMEELIEASKRDRKTAAQCETLLKAEQDPTYATMLASLGLDTESARKQQSIHRTLHKLQQQIGHLESHLHDLYASSHGGSSSDTHTRALGLSLHGTPSVRSVVSVINRHGQRIELLEDEVDEVDEQVKYLQRHRTPMSRDERRSAHKRRERIQQDGAGSAANFSAAFSPIPRLTSASSSGASTPRFEESKESDAATSPLTPSHTTPTTGSGSKIPTERPSFLRSSTASSSSFRASSLSALSSSFHNKLKVQHAKLSPLTAGRQPSLSREASIRAINRGKSKQRLDQLFAQSDQPYMQHINMEPADVSERPEEMSPILQRTESVSARRWARTGSTMPSVSPPPVSTDATLKFGGESRSESEEEEGEDDTPLSLYQTKPESKQQQQTSKKQEETKPVAAKDKTKPSLSFSFGDSSNPTSGRTESSKAAPGASESFAFGGFSLPSSAASSSSSAASSGFSFPAFGQTGAGTSTSTASSSSTGTGASLSFASPTLTLKPSAREKNKTSTAGKPTQKDATKESAPAGKFGFSLPTSTPAPTSPPSKPTSPEGKATPPSSAPSPPAVTGPKTSTTPRSPEPASSAVPSKPFSLGASLTLSKPAKAAAAPSSSSTALAFGAFSFSLKQTDEKKEEATDQEKDQAKAKAEKEKKADEASPATPKTETKEAAADKPAPSGFSFPSFGGSSSASSASASPTSTFSFPSFGATTAPTTESKSPQPAAAKPKPVVSPLPAISAAASTAAKTPPSAEPTLPSPPASISVSPPAPAATEHAHAAEQTKEASEKKEAAPFALLATATAAATADKQTADSFGFGGLAASLKSPEPELGPATAASVSTAAAPAATAPSFGAAAVSSTSAGLFGAAAAPSFGSTPSTTAAAASPFGSVAAPSTSSPFAAASTPAATTTTQPTNLFGTSSASSGGLGLFGGALNLGGSSTSSGGASTGGGLFGSLASSAPAFGTSSGTAVAAAQPAAKTNLFGSVGTGGGLFGAGAQTTPSLFGNTPASTTAGPFGTSSGNAPATNAFTNVFGAASQPATSTAGPFGTSSGGGATGGPFAQAPAPAAASSPFGAAGQSQASASPSNPLGVGFGKSSFGVGGGLGGFTPTSNTAAFSNNTVAQLAFGGGMGAIGSLGGGGFGSSGATPAFGTSSKPGGIFGGGASTAPAFGTGSNSGATAPVFGSSSLGGSQAAFGSSGFGALAGSTPAGSSPFGQLAASGASTGAGLFGQSSGGGGAAASTPFGGGGFGAAASAPTSASPFGALAGSSGGQSGGGFGGFGGAAAAFGQKPAFSFNTDSFRG